jgi:PAS domain S-box-containing protein
MNIPPLPSSIFRSLVHFAPDAFLVVDANGDIAFANAQTETLFGYPREELIGTPVERLIPERFREDHVPHRTEYLAAPAPRAMGSHMALFARRRDGSEFPVEVSLAPMYTDEHMYVSATVRDVTERRAMEEAVRRSEERYRLLAEHAVDVVYRIQIKPPPARIEYVSPSVVALTGYSAEEFYDDPEFLWRVTHPDDQELLQQLLTHPEELGGTVLFRTLHRDGRTVWHEQSFSVVENERGVPVTIEGIARDVTEHRRLEEERRLLQAEAEIERERDRIAADLHDGVMQTMYSVGLRLSGMQRRSPHLTDDDRTSISEAIAGLDGAIGDIRRYVQDLRPLEFNGDLRESLSELARLFRATSDIDTTFDCGVQRVPIDADRSMELFLLVREALSNVRRHAGASSVVVHLDEADGALRLRVTDDGAGFDPEASGLDGHFGLRNMETRARSAGGTFAVMSAAGQGTTILVSVPSETPLPAGSRLIIDSQAS